MLNSRISSPYPNINKKPVLFAGPKKAPLSPKSKNSAHNLVEKAFRDRKTNYILNLEQLLARHARDKNGRRNGVRLISELRTRLDYRPNSLNKIEDLEHVRKASRSPELIIMSRDPKTDKLIKKEELRGSSLDIFESDNQSSPASSVLQPDIASSPFSGTESEDIKPPKRKRGRPKATQVKEEPLSSPEPPGKKLKTRAVHASQSGISNTFHLPKTGSNHSSPALLNEEDLWADILDQSAPQHSCPTLQPPARREHEISF